MTEQVERRRTDDGRVVGLKGDRGVLVKGKDGYPPSLEKLANPPDRLFVVGNSHALQEGLAIVGARKATPYGLSCARRFARAAAERGIVIVSGGARGCDAAAHEAALASGTPTVVFLGGGCDELYPAENHGLFQRVVDSGGAVVSEHSWEEPPLPYRFRMRNRLIAGLALATLIVEAGLPSGTFSTADEALAANRDVLVVPGAITSASSRGANRLLYQGATPIVDDETFDDVLFSLFGRLKREKAPVPFVAGSSKQPRSDHGKAVHAAESDHASGEQRARHALLENPVVMAVRAEPLGMEALYAKLCAVHGSVDAASRLMECLAEAEAAGLVARYPDGRWGPP